VMVSKERNYI